MDDQQRERRRAPRIKIFQPAQMAHGPGDAERVHLLNVSSSGALVYGAAPEPGDEVHLDCGVDLGAARVAWRDGRRFGVRFNADMAPEQMDAVLALQDALYERGRARLTVQVDGEAAPALTSA